VPFDKFKGGSRVSEREQKAEAVLACVECGKRAEGSARGWRALLTVDDEVATYCPECAREEFGE